MDDVTRGMFGGKSDDYKMSSVLAHEMANQIGEKVALALSHYSTSDMADLAIDMGHLIRSAVEDGEDDEQLQFLGASMADIVLLLKGGHSITLQPVMNKDSGSWEVN